MAAFMFGVPWPGITGVRAGLPRAGCGECWYPPPRGLNCCGGIPPRPWPLKDWFVFGGNPEWLGYWWLLYPPPRPPRPPPNPPRVGAGPWWPMSLCWETAESRLAWKGICDIEFGRPIRWECVSGF
jgi:hypothetical protein